MTKKSDRPVARAAIGRLMPRHATLHVGLLAGCVCLALGLGFAPRYAVGIGANGLFIGFLASSALKLPYLSAEYLQEHAREEDTPAVGIVLIVLLVVAVSMALLIAALAGREQPDPVQVALGVASVLLGWFTVQTMGALHYAYEYYQAPGESSGDAKMAGGLEFPGEEPPDGVAFLYFSFTLGTSVATSDALVTSNTMRGRVLVHQVFAHLYNTILLAAAVNVLLSLGGAGG